MDGESGLSSLYPPLSAISEGGTKMNNRGATSRLVLGIAFLVLAVVAGILISTQSQRVTNLAQGPTPAQQGAGPGAVKGQPQFMELFAEWCPPCRQMKPIVNDIEKEYKGKLQIVRVDIDKSPDIARKYQVSAIPVQIIFDKNGKQVYKHLGFLSKADIKTQLNKLNIKSGK